MSINNEKNNVRAAISAWTTVRDLMESADDGDAARAVVDAFAARYEYDTRRGLRRVVLVGEWEVDPEGVAMRRPVASEAAAV